MIEFFLDLFGLIRVKDLLVFIFRFKFLKICIFEWEGYEKDIWWNFMLFLMVFIILVLGLIVLILVWWLRMVNIDCNVWFFLVVFGNNVRVFVIENVEMLRIRKVLMILLKFVLFFFISLFLYYKLSV